MTGIDIAAWREGLSAMADAAVSAVLTIQCAIDWLHPEACELRDEIDAALIAALLARDGLAVDRIVLHSLPVMHDLYKSGASPTPDPAAAAWQIVRRGGAATPLTSYGIDMDEPFGDADPSIYL